ncbi:MAG: hypothetical protein ACTSRS_13565 [Candidatus Helarchaeota archaeon]
MSEIVEKKIQMKVSKNALKDSKLGQYEIKLPKLSADSFLMGEIFIDGEIYGLLGLDKEYWTEDSTMLDLDTFERLILKLYNKRGRNIGMIEERVLKELSQSVVKGTLPVFSITLNSSPYVIDIEKESNQLVFPLLTDEKRGIFEIFQISKKALAIGADYTVTRKVGDQKVAFIDSKRGGKIEIEVYDDELAENEDFIQILILYAGTIQYHDAISEKIKQTVEAIKQGTIMLKPSKKALELMLNPRKARKPRRKEATKDTEKLKEKRSKRRARKLRGVETEEADTSSPKTRKTVKKKIKKRTKSMEQYKELHLKDPVVKASGVGKKTAELLNSIGIYTVEDFLSAGAEEIEAALEVKSITTSKIQKWQNQSRNRVLATSEDEIADSEEISDYELLDYEF